AEHPSTAELMGIPTKLITACVFFASSAMAGMAGSLAAFHLGVASPTLGLTIGLKAVALMVIGGIGSVYGALLAGLLLGAIEVIVVEVARGSLGEAIVWAALLIVLL